MPLVTTAYMLCRKGWVGGLASTSCRKSSVGESPRYVRVRAEYTGASEVWEGMVQPQRPPALVLARTAQVSEAACGLSVQYSEQVCVSMTASFLMLTFTLLGARLWLGLK